MQLLGERRRRRDRGEGEEAVQLARGVRKEVPVGGQHLGARLDRPEGRAADDGVDLVQFEEEGGDDAEVAAAAPDRPVEVRVLVGAGTHALAARQHDLGLDQVVDRQAAFAGQVADAASEREAADAGGRDDAARGRHPVLVGRGIHFSPDAAAADPDRAGPRIDLDVLQAGEVEDDAVVAGAETGAVVGTSTDRQEDVMVGGEGDDLGDVVDVGGARDQPGAAVDHRVVDLAGLVVAGVLGADQLTGEVRNLAAGTLLQGVGGAHTFLLVVVRSHLGPA